MALRKKLYYPMQYDDAGRDINGMPIASAAIRFVGDQSIVNFGVGSGAPGSTDPGADADMFGNVMDPTLFDGVIAANDASRQQRARQAISAWFQASSSQDLQLGDTTLLLAFITATADPIVGAAPIDPATVRRPRLRMQVLPAPGTSFDGTIYIQRQHAIEV